MSSSPDDSPSRTPKRRYNRKHPIHTPGIQLPSSPPQIADLAFNIHGWALEDGLAGERGTYEVINAYRATMIKGGFKAKIKELEGSGREPYREDLSYTARELNSDLAENDPAVAKYLVVGYTLQERDPIWMNNKNFTRFSENELIGETAPSDDHLITWNEILTPVLVVTPVKENTGTSIRLFGLITPRSGLCQPVLLQHERVFYRWEFRASAGARPAQRNKIWNQVAIEKAREFTPPDQLLINQPETPSRSPRVKVKRAPRVKREWQSSSESDDAIIKQEDEDQTALPEMNPDLSNIDVFEMHLDLSVLFETTAERRNPILVQEDRIPLMANIKISLDCETKSILLGIRQSRESRIVRQVDPILRILDVRQDPLVHAQTLAIFCHPEIGIDFQDAHQIRQAIAETWPTLTHLADAGSIFRIKDLMVQSRLGIAFDCIQDFLLRALTSLRRNPILTARDFQITVFDAVRTANPTRSSLPDIRNNAMLLQVVSDLTPDNTLMILLLRELVRFHDWQTDQEQHMMKRAPPFELVASDFTYCVRSDMIAGKDDHYVLSCLQELIGFCQHRQGEVIADVTLWLERLRLRIRQV